MTQNLVTKEMMKYALQNSGGGGMVESYMFLGL